MAVNSYRFLAMYVIIGMLVGMMTAFAQDTSDVDKGYNLNTETRMIEHGIKGEEIFADSESLVQANQFQIASTYLDEKSTGKWLSILRGGFLPVGFIPSGMETTELEQSVNKIVVWFRWMILIFATLEVYFMIINRKYT